MSSSNKKPLDSADRYLAPLPIATENGNGNGSEQKKRKEMKSIQRSKQ